MWPLNPYVRFLVVFTALYVLFLAPMCLGLGGSYTALFRAVGSIFYHDNDYRELSCQPFYSAEHPDLYFTRIEIANRSQMHADDSGPVRDLDIPSVEYGWRPTALLLALILATPRPWKEQRFAIIGGVLLQHIFLLIFLGFLIWDESSEISLVAISPAVKPWVTNFRMALLGQYGLAVPVVIWFLLMFRAKDFSFAPKLSPATA